MEPEMKKPFKTVTTEYFEEIDYDADLIGTRRIRVVTTTEEYCGSVKDPAVFRTYSYL